MNTALLEKRKWTRFNVVLPVTYSKSDTFFKYARAANASEGGLLICLPEKTGIGQYLALKLFLPVRSGSTIIEAVVQVVWMDIHLRKDWTWDYRTGVKFEDISQSDMTHFRNFLLEQEPVYNS